MKFRIVLLLIVIAIKGFAQEKTVAGIVFDKDNKIKLAKIVVQNLNSHQSVYNNLNGVFQIDAEPGDLLVFSKQEYNNDTIKVISHVPIAVYMSKSSIQLKEVTIRDSALSPEKKLAATKREYSKVYGRLGDHDLLSTPSSGGAGLSIDALWNAFSKEGKDATRLRAAIDRDYKQDVIDYRFNKALVTNITSLKEKKLQDFMQKYRPGYFFVINATDYEFIASIKTNLKRYLRNPRAYTLAPLPATKPE